MLVDFWDDGAAPKALTPTLEQISADLGDRVTIVKAKLDEAEQTASNMASAPSLLVLFKDGKECRPLTCATRRGAWSGLAGRRALALL